jgi:hypothetical protein
MTIIINNHRMTINPADFNTTSTLSNDDNDDNVTYLCSYCNTRLRYQSTDGPTGKKIFCCCHCGIDYIPANQLMKKASRFETPSGSGSDGRELLAADPQEDLRASPTRYVERERPGNLSPLFQALKNRGYKWTHYEEH